MGARVTGDELREILSVARKLRTSAQEERDEDYVDLFLRAALALEHRARLLAFRPFDADAAEPCAAPQRAGLHKPVDILC